MPYILLLLSHLFSLILHYIKDLIVNIVLFIIILQIHT